MGVTLGPSNAVTAEGLPVLFIKDLPPVSSIDVRVTRPQIYYGELSNDFVLAPSRQREFDYPAGEGDAAAYSSYDGRGGVPVGSFLRRLLFAIRFGSLNILLSGDLTDRTRILYYRDIRERAERALPFLLFDRDPYMVITTDGRLRVDTRRVYRVRRATRTRTAIAGGMNYMRNSVKVDDRRLRRQRARVSRRAERSDHSHAGAHLSGAAAAARRRCPPTSARTCAIPEDLFRAADRAVRDVSHGEPGDVLSPRRPVADSRRAGRRRDGGLEGRPRARRFCGTW